MTLSTLESLGFLVFNYHNWFDSNYIYHHVPIHQILILYSDSRSYHFFPDYLLVYFGGPAHYHCRCQGYLEGSQSCHHKFSHDYWCCWKHFQHFYSFEPLICLLLLIRPCPISIIEKIYSGPSSSNLNHRGTKYKSMNFISTSLKSSWWKTITCWSFWMNFWTSIRTSRQLSSLWPYTTLGYLSLIFWEVCKYLKSIETVASLPILDALHGAILVKRSWTNFSSEKLLGCWRLP